MNFQHFLNVGEVYMKIFQRVDDVKSDFLGNVEILEFFSLEISHRCDFLM
jgi:hypothetical protein